MANNPSIVPFIRNQFPQHIAESNSLLIPFMEAYYEWMQLDGNVYGVLNDISKLNDIDESLTKFADEFTKEYLVNLPEDLITDKSLTIKHINDLYKAKGTPLATQLLIKMILGKESEIFYPSTQILRASDGEWIQDNSILVEVISGNVFDIVGESVKIATSTLTFNSIVERVKVTEFVGIYEVYLERKLIYEITPNTIVSFNDIVLKSKQTVTNYKILDGGVGFTIGQVFEITSASGHGTVAKVKSVTKSGAIKAIQFIKFGYGYESNFIGGVSFTKASSNVLSQFPNPFDSTMGIDDVGYINKADYYDLSYADASYVGDILASFSTNTGTEADPTLAKIEFILGDKLKYPGYYNSVRGFLSNSIYLQDNLYYQAYSYVVKIDEVLEKYKSKVESTIHPAGMKLFGEYSIKNNFSLVAKLSFVLNFFRKTLLDSTTMQDIFAVFLTKGFVDSITANDATQIAISKLFLESISSLDSSSLSVGKVFSDSTSNFDSTILDFTKSLLESILSVDSPSLFLSTQYLDSISLSDSIAIGLLIDKYFNDTQTVTDNGGSIYFNYYTVPDYWQSDYSQGATTF